jgi:two-component system nitrogen regulation sensor histidine kinase NtrY
MTLQQRIYLIVSGIILIIIALLSTLIVAFEIQIPHLFYWITGVGVISLGLGLALTRLATNRMAYMLRALETGLLNFKDNDFSISLPLEKNDELTRLARLYNQVGEVLRKERQSIYQRELMLDKVMQSSPLCMVLTDENQRVLYSNIAARHLFHQGRRFEGSDFYQLIENAQDTIKQAVKSGKDGLFSITVGDEEQTYHLSQSHFLLNAMHHRLYLFKQLTRELNRQEVMIWKKVIRVISHELNNSLAPISSMAHSGKLLAGDDKKLNLIFNTVQDRVKHLNGFIQGYAQFSKLPMPQRKTVQWQDYVDGLRQQVPFSVIGDLPTKQGNFDPAQMEQVLINLVKNAVESGSDNASIELTVSEKPSNFLLKLSDRGSGMSDQVLQNALLPFYSTKQTGTGLGLPLCREIVEAHEGKMSINNRDGGGLVVSIYLSK